MSFDAFTPAKTDLAPVLSLWLGLITPPAKRETCTDIIREIADFYGLSVAELIGPSRTKEIVQPRQHAMFEVRRRTTMSFPAIGRRFGNRDHTTVLHAVRQHAARLAANTPAKPLPSLTEGVGQ